MSKFGVEVWSIDLLKPYPGNAKKHDKSQIKTLAGLIKQFGWTQPIVVEEDGTIIAGHGRRLAAIELGLDKVPVVVRSDLTPEQADAIRLSDNRVASTDYDTEALQDALVKLNEEGFDLSGLGFDDKELKFLTEDIAIMDDAMFVEDISGAVEEQKKENVEREAVIDESTVSVGDAIGFKRVTLSQSRRIRDFIATTEGETGKKGAEALVAFLDERGL